MTEQSLWSRVDALCTEWESHFGGEVDEVARLRAILNDEARTVLQPSEHEHVFPEEQEPSGRLILAPCLVCEMSALDALAQIRSERDSLASRQVQS